MLERKVAGMMNPNYQFEAVLDYTCMEIIEKLWSPKINTNVSLQSCDLSCMIRMSLVLKILLA